MTSPNTGIKTTTTTEISWYSLGQHLATLNSTDQAAFFDGFSAGIHALGSVDAYHQIAYLKEGVHGYTEWFAEELAAHFADKKVTA